MTRQFSRRDFLKLGGLSVASLAFGRFTPDFRSFDDSNVVRVATKSVSVYSTPSDDLKKSTIVGTWYKDDLVHVYEEVVAEEPKFNPIWYRVWGGYMHRARLQRVKTILNLPLSSMPEGTRMLAEVTVPFTHPWRKLKTSWQDSLQFRLYYGSVYWIEGVEPEGPDGQPWYRVFDELASIYYVPAVHMRLIPSEELTPISPEIPWENKRIDVNLTTQTFTAFEYDKIVFQTTISSGLPYGKTATSVGTFNIDPKTPSKHMGNGNLFAGVDDYELPGVPWTSFFTGDGQAFHGTYWHENFGTPMSHGCINMRTEEAKWVFRWTRPTYDLNTYLRTDNPGGHDVHGYGTTVKVHY